MSDTFLEQFEKRRQERLAADRTITLAGEEIRYRPAIPPEVALRLEEMQERYTSQNGDGGVSSLAMVNVADETILACLEPESHAAWGRLRDPAAAYPLSLEDVFEIAGYLLARATGLPTDAPADSSDGRTPTVTTSKARLSSRARTRKR